MEKFSNFLSHLKFFRKYKRDRLKSENVLRRTDALRHYNRDFVCLNEKLSEFTNFVFSRNFF